MINMDPPKPQPLTEKQLNTGKAIEFGIIQRDLGNISNSLNNLNIYYAKLLEAKDTKITELEEKLKKPAK